ncbi:DUF6266 family protein [Pedobacter sp. NJ-S-72]
MPATNNIDVKVVDNRITFKWDETIINERMKGTDRVMLLAYLPQENRAISLIGGAERLEGGEYLIIPECKEGIHMETYVSFLSADYKSISNSVYCGSFIK